LKALLEDETARKRLLVEQLDLAAGQFWGLTLGPLFWPLVLGLHPVVMSANVEAPRIGCGAAASPPPRISGVLPGSGSLRSDHWTPERSRGRQRYRYAPFSAGRRMCIGNQFTQNEAPGGPVPVRLCFRRR
jgi:hypothetical protein